LGSHLVGLVIRSIPTEFAFSSARRPEYLILSYWLVYLLAASSATYLIGWYTRLQLRARLILLVGILACSFERGLSYWLVYLLAASCAAYLIGWYTRLQLRARLILLVGILACGLKRGLFGTPCLQIRSSSALDPRNTRRLYRQRGSYRGSPANTTSAHQNSLLHSTLSEHSLLGERLGT
jgi:hypothetical protein